jgi:hypothetical protein
VARLALLLTVFGVATSFGAPQTGPPKPGAPKTGAPYVRSESGDPSARVTLRAVGGLAAHVVGKFRDPIAFAVARSGEYVVLDSRAHTVYLIDRSGETIRKTLPIGLEQGKFLSPASLSLASDIFAVADAPMGHGRIQYFTLAGETIGAFFLPPAAAPASSISMSVLSQIRMAFTGRTFVVNLPQSGALISEIDTTGAVVRQIGSLRVTDHEADRDLHTALNVGMPLPDPTGGFYFVFQTGVPMFRKYSADGRLLFQRHIEGVELDAALQSLPTTWPKRPTETGVFPVVPPLVRTAVVDPAGRLWVSLIEPHTYVYSPQGDKIRTVRFEGATVLPASSLFFADRSRLLVTPGCYEFKIEF